MPVVGAAAVFPCIVVALAARRSIGWVRRSTGKAVVERAAEREFEQIDRDPTTAGRPLAGDGAGSMGALTDARSRVSLPAPAYTQSGRVVSREGLAARPFLVATV